MKPLHEYPPWRVVTVALAIGLTLPWVLLVVDVFILRHLRAWGLL